MWIPSQLAEDVAAHVRVPATRLVAEVDSGLQQLLEACLGLSPESDIDAPFGSGIALPRRFRGPGCVVLPGRAPFARGGRFWTGVIVEARAGRRLGPVAVVDLALHASRAAVGDDAGGQVPGDDGTGADDRVLADRDAGADDHAGAEPDAVREVDRLRRSQAARRATGSIGWVAVDQLHARMRAGIRRRS